MPIKKPLKPLMSDSIVLSDEDSDSQNSSDEDTDEDTDEDNSDYDINDNFDGYESENSIQVLNSSSDNSPNASVSLNASPNTSLNDSEVKIIERKAKPKKRMPSKNAPIRAIRAPHMTTNPNKKRNGRKDINELIEDQELGIRTIDARKKESQRMNRLINRLSNSGRNINSLRADIDIESEDHNNLIQHKNDDLNHPDIDGRVLVNVGHSGDEQPIYLAKSITEKVMAHQIGGIRFLYDNLIESVKDFKKFDGFGCVLSHSMGLGKTVQIIAIVDIFLRNTSAKTVMIVLPVNVLNNWMLEFEKWVPKWPFQVYSIGKLNGRARNKVINDWSEDGGVLLIGYEKFLRISSNIEEKINKQKECTRREMEEAQELKEQLIDPGADLVICDEGHRIKNDASGISRALKKIKTRRRVILTGYPLQNKLKEYYCMVDFVRPNYLGLKWEFNNSFERPITNGQCQDSTESDKQLMRERSHVLSQLLKGFIQRRMEDVMKPLLPEKQEFVVLCKLSQKQRELMEHFLNEVLTNKMGDAKGNISLFRTFVVCSKICNHPDIIHNTLENGDTSEEIDTDEQPQLLAYAWAKKHFRNYQKHVLSNSNKMLVLFDIIEETVAKGDKLLVFSQWLFTLDLIERLLTSRNWNKNKSYYRLDGQTKPDERERLIDKFNSEGNREVRLFLISTKAGGIGINLTGANRIVLFDACWNPCHDAQASCRIYRPGQSKPCFIYRLISENSMEKRIFNKQILKQAMSKGVVDQQNIDLKLNQREVRALMFELRKELEQIEEQTTRLDSTQLNQLKDPILLAVCRKSGSYLSSVPLELDTYFIENKELDLTSAQKKQAFQAFEENERLNQISKPNYSQNVDSLTDRLKNTKI